MRILLVEDERKVASFVARALRENSYAVDIAETGEEALLLAQEAPYDAIILDIRLPGINGLEVCRQMRQNEIKAPILMLTARSMVEQRVEGLDAGADDYLAKPFALAELYARLRALTRRSFNKTGVELRLGDLILDRRRRHVIRGDREVSLTSKEFAMLELLMLRAPNTVTRSEIVNHIWDSNFDSGTNLVEVYINRLRHKIDRDRSTKLIQTVRGMGYHLVPPE